MSDKHWYLISYDIRDAKRWRVAYRRLKGIGERIQYSLFRARMNRTEMEKLRWELERLLTDEDDLMFVHLCPGCSARIHVRNEANDFGEPPERFEIL